MITARLTTHTSLPSDSGLRNDPSVNTVLIPISIDSLHLLCYDWIVFFFFRPTDSSCLSGTRDNGLIAETDRFVDLIRQLSHRCEPELYVSHKIPEVLMQ